LKYGLEDCTILINLGTLSKRAFEAEGSVLPETSFRTRGLPRLTIIKFLHIASP
jgi:hypothetical protein